MLIEENKSSLFLAGTELVLAAIDFFPPEETVSSSPVSSAVDVASSVAAAVALDVVPTKRRAFPRILCEFDSSTKPCSLKNLVFAIRASAESAKPTNNVARIMDNSEYFEQLWYFILQMLFSELFSP